MKMHLNNGIKVENLMPHIIPEMFGDERSFRFMVEMRHFRDSKLSSLTAASSVLCTCERGTAALSPLMLSWPVRNKHYSLSVTFNMRQSVRVFFVSM